MAPLETLTAGWYNLFYSIAVIVAGIVMFAAGRRRGWDGQTWAITVAGWAVAGVVGAMLPRLVFGEAIAARTSVGAVAFATLALAVGARVLKRRPGEVLDTTAIAIPLGAAVVRVGCFLAECCQGVTTSLAVGVALHADDEPRHAVQLYEAVLETMLAVALMRTSREVRPGARFTLSMAAMCGIRFVTEFVRDNEKYSGLSLAQWIVLPVGAICLMLLLSRRRTAHPRVITAEARTAALGLVGIVAMVAVIVGLPPLEATMLILGSGVALAVVARRMTRLAPAGMAALMLQIPAVGSDSGTYPRIYTSIGGGASAAMWEARHRYTNCDGETIHAWKRSHQALGVNGELGVRRQSSFHRGTGIRVRGYADANQVGAARVTVGTVSQPGSYSQNSGSLGVIGDVDWKYLGLSFGGSMGRMYPTLEDADAGTGRGMPISSWPAAGLRVGRLDGVSLEARFGDDAGVGPVAPTASFAFAGGDSLGNRIRLGVTEAGFVVSGRRRIRDNLEILPTLVIGGSADNVGSQVGGHTLGAVMIRKWFRVAGPSPTAR